jgi:hypothetical protein
MAHGVDKPKTNHKIRTSIGASKNTRFSKKNQKKTGKKSYRGQGR